MIVQNDNILKMKWHMHYTILDIVLEICHHLPGFVIFGKNHFQIKINFLSLNQPTFKNIMGKTKKY